MSNNKTIAKNSLFLYFRMFLIMGVGLYTSRLVLQALGVIDYGIYGLVGGIVSTFAFLNSAMASATQRYLSFDIGKNNTERLQKTFNSTLNIHILIALIILIFAETLGLWFLNFNLKIPAGRIVAANWVYQFSIFAFILEIIQVPYNALLFAREHMNVYAYISILEAILKLIIVFLLLKTDTDKLILYSLLTFCVVFVIRLIYKIYCKKHFKESRYKFYFDKAYYKELMSYSGWNLFGNIANVARGQGSNILLNMFFGPIANTAYSLAIMVQGIIGSFVGNFQVAINPQITKSYAKGELATSLNLIYKSSKFSFFAMFIIAVPFLYNINYIMHLWLKTVPPYTIEFLKLTLIYSLVETISNPLMVGAQATGKIKWYQIIIGSFIFLTLPITAIVFYYSSNPINVYWVLIIISLFALLFRISFLKRMLKLDVAIYVREVILPIIFVSAITCFFIYFSFKYSIIIDIDNEFLNFVANTIMIISVVFVVIVIFGLDKVDRIRFLKLIRAKLCR
ncbi:Na+-driven multidrug efflux pump [Epilithonimonas hungarica]|uniref:Na+-driven multidrug efflux pump n=1 Tax=Epilithonimonas hungarica TaxID=454006 RepID=A0A1G7GGS1_9FLAO|nr:Na+-driven multidrug efflux pump [Epilithonimonas hungarica]